MTRSEAAAVCSRLAVGLQPDAAGAARLLERISAAEDPEGLRSALMERGAEALLDDRPEPDVDDAGQAVRLRMEAERAQVIEDGAAVAAALDVVQRAAAQVAAATLPIFAERVGRAYARAMARMHGELRDAVRAAVAKT